MKFDDFGAVMMEQCPPPGCYGDSCAETGRYFNLMAVRKHLGMDYQGLLDHYVDDTMDRFITARGYIRHPLVPEDWKETDFSSDQAIPLYLSLQNWGLDSRVGQFHDRIRQAGDKTGNGDLIAPPLWAVMNKSNQALVSDLVILGYGLTLKYAPVRWSDAHNKFEETDTSSADYLNFIHCVFNQVMTGNTIIGTLTRKLFTADQIRDKLHKYYSNEPNVDWLLKLYDEAINEVWK